MSTINQRLAEYIESEKINSPDVYKAIGASRQTWNGWIGHGRPISLAKTQGIVTFCKNLNARWLLTGEGEMLVTSSGTTEKGKTPDSVADVYKAIAKEREEKIQELNREIGSLKNKLGDNNNKQAI
jgi:hypothetical protein